MDITTESELAAMIMMSGDGAILRPVTLSFSLDSIRALDNMATITIGEYIWECKVPVIMFCGTVDLLNYEYGRKVIRYRHSMPFLINDKYGMIYNYTDSYPDMYQWFIDDKGIEHSYKWIYSNYRVSGISFDKRLNYSFINPEIHYSLYGTRLIEDDGSILAPTEIYMGDVRTSGSTVITDMTPYEQIEFERKYLETASLYEPVINIVK